MSKKSNRDRDLVDQVQQASRKVREIQKDFARTFVKLEKLESVLLELQIELGARGAPPSAKAARRETKLEAMLRRRAVRGARLLEIQVERVGARVRVDGETWFGLPPRLARLLLILADDGEGDGKAFPRLQSPKEIARRLTEGTDEQPDPSGVSNLLYRLKERLRDHDVNPFFVETTNGRSRFRHRSCRIERIPSIPAPRIRRMQPGGNPGPRTAPKARLRRRRLGRHPRAPRHKGSAPPRRRVRCRAWTKRA